MEGLNKKEKLFGKYNIDSNGFVNLGDIARGEIKRQAQYISRFVDGLDSEYPNLSDGLVFCNIKNERTGESTGNYHEYRIHKDSVDEFVKRVTEYYKR